MKISGTVESVPDEHRHKVWPRVTGESGMALCRRVCSRLQMPVDRNRALAAALLALVVSLISFLQAAASREGLHAPPRNGGDEDSYERLGYNLASGMGFGYCPGDQAVLAGKEDPRPVDRCACGCPPDQFEVTAYRPPGFPFVIAAIYCFSPLNFLAVRVFNCLCCSLAVSVTVYAFARQFSVAAAIGITVLCSVDPRFREFAGTFLTENLATATFCVFAVMLSRFVDDPDPRRALLCGAALSALVFTRSFYVAWYPVLWTVVAVFLTRRVRNRRVTVRGGIWVFSLFAGASLVLTGPWWIRNCVALKAVMPTGTQGGIGIADGFSESAWQNHGSWTSVTADQILTELRRDPATSKLNGIELEKEHCRRGAASARRWILENPERIPQLSWWKLSRLWEWGSALHGALFCGMFFGILVSRSQSLSKAMLILLILNSLTVMATYHTYERFFTPFRPLVHGFASIGYIRLCAVSVGIPGKWCRKRQVSGE